MLKIIKKRKMLKKALCLIFAFLFSINSFAAIVSDNDGAAFVTKAEFEALKTDFNSQIDQYNQSIDSKIDGAIASYLAARAGKKEQLDNIIESIGGENIRFGLPSFEACVAPKTGFATYFINCMPDGFTLNNQGGNFYCINNPAESRWTTDGQGITGIFRVYRVKNGAKYLLSSKKEMLQACYIGGWYSNSNYRNVTQDYPFGSAPTVFKQPVVVGTNYGVDCYTSVYRPYTQRTWTDLQKYTSSWSASTTSNQIVVNETEYNLPSAYRNNGTYNYNAHEGSHTINDMKVTFTNTRIYGWTTTTEPWSNFSPGFMMNSNWKTKLYGGVPFFETDTPGNIKIKNLKFVNTSSVGSDDVYFAISFGEFVNSDTLNGNVKFDKIENATLYDESQNLYKATSGVAVNLEFEADKKGVYYIKCQYQTTKPTANDNKYTTIKNGTEIIFTEG